MNPRLKAKKVAKQNKRRKKYEKERNIISNYPRHIPHSLRIMLAKEMKKIKVEREKTNAIRT